MAMLKGLFGGAAGAAAYNIYQESDKLAAGGSMTAGLIEMFKQRGATQVAEASRVQRQVDELQSALLKTLRERGSGPQQIIVRDGGSGRGGNVVVGVVVVVGGVALYLRFVKGWQLSDFMYVTRGALNSMQEAVNKGITTMKIQMEAATADLLARLGAVTDKQDNLLDRQQEMDGQLRVVGGRIEDVQGGVQQLHDQVAYSNTMITYLCGAMSEVCKRVGHNNSRYVQKLDGILHQQPMLAGAGGGYPQVLLLDPSMTPTAAPPQQQQQQQQGARATAGMATLVPNPAVYALNSVAAAGGAERVAAPQVFVHGLEDAGAAAAMGSPNQQQQQQLQQGKSNASWASSVAGMVGLSPGRRN